MAVAIPIRKWTLEEMHRLPEDGNKYELVRGELFVTPPPAEEHQVIAARLHAILAPYVAKHSLGLVFSPRSVVRYKGSEVEPDLMVRPPHPNPTKTDRDWSTAPTPVLVVEVLSPFTRRRDFMQKRSLYLDAGVPEYWIVDPEARSITVARKGVADRAEHGRLVWAPAEASASLEVEIPALFDS